MISHNEVSPFGHLRIEGCLAPPRSVSPPRRVLHRLPKPRHPPYALQVSSPRSCEREKRTLENRNNLLLFLQCLIANIEAFDFCFTPRQRLRAVSVRFVLIS